MGTLCDSFCGVLLSNTLLSEWSSLLLSNQVFGESENDRSSGRFERGFLVNFGRQVLDLLVTTYDYVRMMSVAVAGRSMVGISDACFLRLA